MAWTANVTAISTNEANIVATVDFINGGEKITRQVPANDLTPDRLAFYCQRVIVQLETRDAGIAALAAGPVTLPRDAKTGTLATAATAATAADDFFARLASLNALKVQADKGIIPTTDPAIATAESNVKSAFLPEYATDPRFR